MSADIFQFTCTEMSSYIQVNILCFWGCAKSILPQKSQWVAGKNIWTRGGFSNYFYIYCDYLSPALDSNPQQEKQLKVSKYRKWYDQVSPDRIHWFWINLSKQEETLCQTHHNPRVCSAAKLGKDGITNMSVVGQKMQHGKDSGHCFSLYDNLQFKLSSTVI